MTTSSSNNIKERSETSVDYELICTICNKPFNDLQYFVCDDAFCRQCIRQEIEVNQVSYPTCQQGVTINNFSEVSHTVRKINKASSAIDEHNLSSNITFHQNEQQNQYSAAFLFEPFRDLLSDLINQNKKLREEMNQLQSNEQPKKNEELQLQFEQFKKQSQLQLQTLTEQLKNVNNQYDLCVKRLNEHLPIETNQLQKQSQPQHQTLVEQLKNVNNQYDLCVKQLNEQSKTNEKLQLKLNKLTEQNEIQLTGQSRKNEELQIAVNQIREQNETQLTKQTTRNEELQFCISQLREQNRLQFTEQSRKNENLQLAVNQLTGQSKLQLTEQSRKNEDLQLVFNQLKEQSQLQYQTLTKQLKNVNNQHDLCVKRLNEQSKKNEELQLELDQLKEHSQLQLSEQSKKNEEFQLDINQLNEKNAKHSTLIDRLQTDDQNQDTKIREIDQRHSLLEINVESLGSIVKNPPGKYVIILRRRKNFIKEHRKYL
jgi:hypothetical protein